MSLKSAREFWRKTHEDEYDFLNFLGSENFDCTLEEIEQVQFEENLKNLQEIKNHFETENHFPLIWNIIRQHRISRCIE